MVRELTKDQTDTLIARYVRPHPSNVGIDEYWLEEPGIPVWAIVGSMHANERDAADVASLYHISQEAVEAAWAFYLRHRSVIDNRLARNAADYMAVFYLDEDTPEALATPLRRLGHVVVTTTPVGRKGTKDYEQLWFAAQHQWIFVTLNRADYTLLHGAWQHWGVAHPHAGVIVLHHMRVGDLERIGRDIDALSRHPGEFFMRRVLTGESPPLITPQISPANHLFRRWQSGRWDCIG